MLPFKPCAHFQEVHKKSLERRVRLTELKDQPIKKESKMNLNSYHFPLVVRLRCGQKAIVEQRLTTGFYRVVRDSRSLNIYVRPNGRVTNDMEHVFDVVEALPTEDAPSEPISLFEQHDAVNSPSHYTQGGVECIDALASATVNLSGEEAFCTANAIKYLWRWKQKNGIEDLQKAKWYIDRIIAKTAYENKETK